MIYKYFDIVLFWILLFYDFNDIKDFFNSNKHFDIFDLAFNMWFILLIFIICRRIRNKNLIDSILDFLGLKFKK